MSKRIYVAGPMRGYPELNFPAFNQAAEDLRAEGWFVVNPVEVNPDKTTPYNECMRKDIAALVTCDAIYMLIGWEQSEGANVEHTVAQALGMEFFYEEDDFLDNNNEEENDEREDDK